MPKAVEPQTKAKAVKAEKEPKEKKDRGLGSRKEATLKSMQKLGGKALTHGQIAEITGKAKGNQLRELTALGLVDTKIPEEGKREHSYSLTTEGRKVASKIK
jgi:hypothetical protein